MGGAVERKLGGWQSAHCPRNGEVHKVWCVRRRAAREWDRARQHAQLNLSGLGRGLRFRVQVERKKEKIEVSRR